MVPKFLRTVIIVLLGIALAGGITLGLFVGVLGIRVYQGKYTECNHKELFPTLEWVFDVDFPVNAKEVKAAKTPSREGSVHFIVKFCADPNTVNRFLEFAAERCDFEPYERGYAFTTNGWPSPRWARTPIKQGRKHTLRSIKGELISTDAHLYVDTTNKENFVVYVEGSYRINLEK